MKLKTICAMLLLISNCYARGQSNEKDTAIVKQYNYISVFYNCVPLHPYKNLGKGSGYGVSIDWDYLKIKSAKTLAELFELYANAAKAHYQNCTGIIFKDIHFGRDVFEAIQTIHPDSREDTAIFSTPVFVNAKPIRAYDTLGIIISSVSFKSLNSGSERCFKKAKKRYPACDGIMIDNVEYVFGTCKIVAFRWRKN